MEGKTTCIDNPGLTWESRNDKHCEIYWPSARSGHAVVYDEKRGGMWLHGGYSTYYPYPTSKSAGSSFGNRELGREVTALTPTLESLSEHFALNKEDVLHPSSFKTIIKIVNMPMLR